MALTKNKLFTGNYFNKLLSDAFPEPLCNSDFEEEILI